MNKTKEKFESLLLLNYKLCLSSENEINEVCNQIIEIFDYIKKYYLFPVNLSVGFQEDIAQICNKYSNSLRIIIAKELYAYLINTMFELLALKNDSVFDVYFRILELIRTEFSYKFASICVDNYICCPEFSYYGRNKRYKSTYQFLRHAQNFTEIEFQTYKNKLRENPLDNKTAFPQERSIPKSLLSKIDRSFNDSIAKYHKYIDDNYLSIHKAFKYYNKELRVYVHEPMDDETYVLTINSYENTNSRIIVYPYFVGAMYKYSNIEEISKPPSSSNSILFDPDNPNFDFLFCCRAIYHNLNRLFVRYASIDDLRDYLVYLLRGELEKVSVINDTEITIGKNHCQLLFSDIPTIDNLQLLFYNESDAYKTFSFAFRFTPSNDIINVFDKVGIPYINVAEKGRLMIKNENGEMIHWFIKSRLDRIQLDESYRDRPIGERLIEQLMHCPKGQEGWKQYEDIGTDIFKFLFENGFRNYTFDYQSSTLDRIRRRDLVINNTYKDNSSFWRLVKNDYNSNIIIVDFKNYNKALNSNEFYTPTKYLNPIAGNFLIVFSRLGLDENAKAFQLELLNKNILILCLSDDDLISMITQKMNGQDPLNSLEDKFYTLCKSK